MKHTLTLLLALVAFAAQSQTGKIVFLRKTGYAGSAGSFKVFIDEKMVCKLGNKKYSVHEVPTGEHGVIAQFSGTKAKEEAKTETVKFKVEDGKTYYVNLILETGFLKNNLYCQEITESTWQKMKDKLKEDTDCIK